MKRITKALCLIVGVVMAVVGGNEIVAECKEQKIYTYNGWRFAYIEKGDGVEITGVSMGRMRQEQMMVLDIPAKIDERPVVSIGDNALQASPACRVNLPKSITEIGSCAFYHCENLEKIYIPDGVTRIGSSAFEQCRSLKKIELPDKLKQIEPGTFRYCEKLKSIKIPDEVEIIGYDAFLCCTNLKKVELSDGLKEIGVRAFLTCESLEEIELPESLESIGGEAFGNCFKLTELVVPDGAAESSGYAPGGCIVHVHKYENEEMTSKERCYAMACEGKALKCLECGYEASHRFVDGKVIGGSKLVAPLIREGTCDVCGVAGRWNDWSYAWITGIVAVALLGFVVAIINYMRRMKKS